MGYMFPQADTPCRCVEVPQSRPHEPQPQHRHVATQCVSSDLPDISAATTVRRELSLENHQLRDKLFQMESRMETVCRDNQFLRRRNHTLQNDVMTLKVKLADLRHAEAFIRNETLQAEVLHTRLMAAMQLLELSRDDPSPIPAPIHIGEAEVLLCRSRSPTNGSRVRLDIQLPQVSMSDDQESPEGEPAVPKVTATRRVTFNRDVLYETPFHNPRHWNQEAKVPRSILRNLGMPTNRLLFNKPLQTPERPSKFEFLPLRQMEKLPPRVPHSQPPPPPDPFAPCGRLSVTGRQCTRASKWSPTHPVSGVATPSILDTIMSLAKPGTAPILRRTGKRLSADQLIDDLERAFHGQQRHES